LSGRRAWRPRPRPPSSMGIALPWSWRWWPGGRRPEAEAPGRSPDPPGTAEAADPQAADAGDDAAAETRFGGGGRRSRYVTVYVAGTMAEGHVVKGRLEAEDIPALLKYDPLDSVLYPALSPRGVAVQVAVGLVDRARLVLEED